MLPPFQKNTKPEKLDTCTLRERRVILLPACTGLILIGPDLYGTGVHLPCIPIYAMLACLNTELWPTVLDNLGEVENRLREEVSMCAATGSIT